MSDLNAKVFASVQKLQIVIGHKTCYFARLKNQDLLVFFYGNDIPRLLEIKKF